MTIAYKLNCFFLNIDIVLKYFHFLSLTLTLILNESDLNKTRLLTSPGLPAYGAFASLLNNHSFNDLPLSSSSSRSSSPIVPSLYTTDQYSFVLHCQLSLLTLRLFPIIFNIITFLLLSSPYVRSAASVVVSALGAEEKTLLSRLSFPFQLSKILR